MRSFPHSFRHSLFAVLLLLAASQSSAGEEAIHLLANAIKNGTLETVEELLAKGVSPNQRIPGAHLGYSPLALAVNSNHPAITRALLKAGADPTTEDENGDTVMTMAADPEHLAVAKVLLEHGVSIDVRNRAGITALLRAARYANKEEIQTILDLGADPNVMDPEGNTPLMIAAGNGKLTTAELLIKAGAKVDLRNKQGLSALQIIFREDIYQEESEEIPRLVELLLAHGADVNQRDSDQRTLLMRSVVPYGLLFKSIEVLLAAKPDLSPKDKDGRDILFLVMQKNNPKLPAKRFIGLGADIKTADSNNTDLLMLAAWHGDTELIRSFLDSGLSPANKTKQGYSAVHNAARRATYENSESEKEATARKGVEVLKLLESHGGSLTDATAEGLTPLHLAALAGTAPVVAHLLPHYPSPDIRDKEGNAPLHLAAGAGNQNVIELLTPGYKDIDIRNQTGNTPLMLASSIPDESSALCLIKAGADVNARDSKGITALASALSRNDATHVKFLIENGADPKSLTDPNSELLRLARLFHLQAVPPQELPYLIDLLLGLTSDINIRDADGMSVLMWMAASGSQDALGKILKHNPDLNQRSPDGRTALMWAACSMAEKSMAVLLEKGADDTLRDSTGRTATDWLEWSRNVKPTTRVETPGNEPPLWERIAESRRAALQEYLQRGGWSISDRIAGVSPLHLAACLGDIDAMATLLKHGAPPDQPISDDSTALMEAAVNGHLKTVEYLLEHGADAALRNSGSNRAIDLAVANGHAEVARLLLGRDKSLSDDETTLLTGLIRQGDAALLRDFLEKGVSIPPKGKREDDSYGGKMTSATPIAVAAASPAVDLLKTLAAFPAATGMDEPTYVIKGLHVAAGNGFPDNVRYLIEELKVDPNVLLDNSLGGVMSLGSSDRNPGKFVDGFSPLSLALESGYPEVVSYLLEHGAIVTGRTRSGAPPLNYAIEKRQVDILELLLRNKPDTELVDYYGNTALHRAAALDDSKAVSLLLEAGAALDAKNTKSQTPLDVATAEKAEKVIALLTPGAK